MNTLRDLGIFVGIPQDSGEYGAPQPPIGLRLVAKLLAPAAPAGLGGSVRAMLSLVKTLSPIALDARLLDPDGGEEPFSPAIRIAASPGLVTSTRIHFIQSGKEFAPSQNYGAGGGDFSPIQLGPGAWTIAVRRAGIGHTGYVRLEKSFNVTVRSTPVDMPIDLTPPSIMVKASGSLKAITYVVTGSGFLRNQPDNRDGVAVRVVNGPNPQDWLMLFTGSNRDGQINLTTEALDTTIIPRDAAGEVKIVFTATDKRKNPNSVPRNEPLWSNAISFLY